MSSASPPVYVIGHRNPDTDAICSAIAYADLLARTSQPTARPARCGSITARTEWVLNQAGIPAPERIMDVRQRVGRICLRDIITAKSTETFIEVYSRMLNAGLRGMPVVDEQNQVQGMLSLLDLLALLLPPAGDGEAMRTVRTSLANVQKSLGGAVRNDSENSSEQSDYMVMVAASSEKVMAEKIDHFPKDRIILVTGDRPTVQKLGVEKGVRCLVVTGGFPIGDDILKTARDRGVCVISAPRDTASTTQMIRGSRSICGAISTDFRTFDPSTLVEDARRDVASSHQAVFPVIDPLTNQLTGSFSKSDLINPTRVKIVLVDHNEFSQAVAGADEAEILEVLDHHRLSGNLVSHEPIQFINKPVGSTCTIVASSFQDHGIQPTRAIATCLCAGLVSDTLNLTSPTTTAEDRTILAWLAGIAGIDIDQFTTEFFATGSALRTLSTADALGSDRKEYVESGYKVSISQIEEVGLQNFWPKRDALREELKNLVAGDIDVACLMVTDVGRHYSILMIEAPACVIERVDFPPTGKANSYAMDGVVSRKKQLFPWISRLLSGIAS